MKRFHTSNNSSIVIRITQQLGNKVELSELDKLKSKIDEQSHIKFIDDAKQYFNQLMEEIYTKIKNSLNKNSNDIVKLKSLVSIKVDESSLQDLTNKVKRLSAQ